ncbi:MAG TPA: hypothetical protein VM030_03010 [Acidimicrobiales bacterium]|nr:hypothetical protein [Acidimicrobiales bacterium]
MHLLIGALSWDPTVRGLLIVITAFAILPGSVYLLLATNIGARIGFLVALTGLFGWLAIMGIVWQVFGIGNRGALPTWKVQEVVTGQVEQSTVEAVSGFPARWSKLELGDRILGDAQAAADKVLSKSAAAAPEAGGHGSGGEGGDEEEAHLEPVFDAPEDYVQVGGYHRGGETYMLTFLHKPHYAVVQVQPVVEQTVAPGAAPPRPRPDTAKPVTSVIMLRDLGNVRFPPFMLALSSTIIFLVLCSILHRRDKEIMAARAATAAG